MNSIDMLKQLSEELNLEFASQDWGIINASANRVSEFINFFENNSELSETMRYQVFELIIASFNEAILERKNSVGLNAQCHSFIEKNSKNNTFSPILRYWRNLEGDEFPVSNFL